MSDAEKGKVIVLAAPSGAGKSTLAGRLMKEFDRLRFSVSATTRPPRSGEADGVDYYFLSPGSFDDKVEQGDFLEWEEFYNGTRYGTLRSDIESLLDQGYSVLLDVDVLGAESVKKIYGDRALVVFIAPPSMEVLEKRLRDRGTETPRQLETRIRRARKEMRWADRFDYRLVNDELEVAYGQLRSLVSRFTGLEPHPDGEGSSD